MAGQAQQCVSQRAATRAQSSCCTPHPSHLHKHSCQRLLIGHAPSAMEPHHLMAQVHMREKGGEHIQGTSAHKAWRRRGRAQGRQAGGWVLQDGCLGSKCVDSVLPGGCCIAMVPHHARSCCLPTTLPDHDTLLQLAMWQTTPLHPPPPWHTQHTPPPTW
jgi:hypothetical protein